MSVLCGRCGKYHPTVADVRECHKATAVKKKAPTKPPTKPRWPAKKVTAKKTTAKKTKRGETTLPRTPRAPSQPRPPVALPHPAKDPRLTSLSAVMVTLAAFCDATPSLDTLNAWSRSPWTKRIVGYRKQMVLEVMEGQTRPAVLDLPKFVAQRLEARSKLAGQDASMLLAGRQEWRMKGGRSPRPADAELHKKIGPVDFEGI